MTEVASPSEIEQLKELVKSQAEQFDELEERVSHLRENTVHTAAVERVLLEYDISPELVDEVIEAIETVDEGMWGDGDE